MRQKRSKLLTLMFSLLPGAGHMFMGFMKTGISLWSNYINNCIIVLLYDNGRRRTYYKSLAGV